MNCSPHTIALIDVIEGGLLVANFAYLISGVVLRHQRDNEMANVIWHWMKWPALVKVLLDVPLEFLTEGDVAWYEPPSVVLGLFFWWWLRNAGDDDNYKKTKKRMKQKVTVKAGRLVVVPRQA